MQHGAALRVARSLLQNGVSMEDMSKLLGHQTLRITENHYNAWVPARLNRLEDTVRRIGDEDLPAAHGGCAAPTADYSPQTRLVGHSPGHH